MNLEYLLFSEINFSDVFFDTLKEDYKELPNWFAKKSASGERAYVFKNDRGLIDGFLYLKIEEEAIIDISPPLPNGRHLKIGTFKINAHGTKLGERYLKKIFDYMIVQRADDAYVTVFEKHTPLINLFMKYGFQKYGEKQTHNGNEIVLVKNLKLLSNDVVKNYPLINMVGVNKYLLAIYPKYHSRLFPDSILRTEKPDVVIKDTSHTNSIHKVYICGMRGVDRLRRDDIIVIYRTAEDNQSAKYSSVATSICVVEEYRNITEFITLDDFLSYCLPYSVFSQNELIKFWEEKKYPNIIRFTYNAALPKRPNRDALLNIVKLQSDYWGFFPISDEQLLHISHLGQLNESIIIH